MNSFLSGNYRKSVSLIFSISFFAAFFFACLAGLAQTKSEIIVKIGDEEISSDEFMANYRKNNTNVLNEKDKKTPEEYLDLYINFKLKVLEARRLGYDTVRSFVDELNGYRQELARPYLTDVQFNDEMVRTAYHRTQYERKASHLMIRLNQDALPADTLTAWNKLNALRQQILNGADFNEMAAKHSEDPSAVQNKGLLGYFGAFQMVYPFEEMTYRTPVGQVSEIVRSRFGYHIIKVHDERLAPGEIKAAHIMKMFPQQASDETIARLKLSADSIWQKVISGADFGELAKKYSDDKQTAAEGGELNWFTPTNMIPAFAEAAFLLKNDGDISPVIRTPFGWHIIKRLELRTTPSFEKLKAELESKIRQNPDISKHSDEAFDHKLKTEYQLRTDEKLFAKLVSSVSDTPNDWINQVSGVKNETFLSFADQKFTLAGFIDYLQRQKFQPSAQSETDLKNQLNSYIHIKLTDYENTRLEAKYPEFARIYQEYHDGILLFNISKDKIWDVASNDSARLQTYFDQTSKKYYWTNRFKGWIIETKNEEIRSRVETMLDQKELSQQELSDVFNTPTEKNVQFTEVAAEKGENPVIDYLIWSGPKPSGFNETTTFVHGKIVPSEIKALKDAWGLYSSDFQEQVEKEWIYLLRKQYPVTINKKVLKKIKVIE